MLRHVNRNPLLFTLRQHVHKQPPFPLISPVRNGDAAASDRTCLFPFAVFFFSSLSAATRSLARESPEKLGLVLDLLRTYGFTDSQIKQFIPRAPSIYSTEIIKPKLEYLLALGFSRLELARIICFYPTILGTSLKERIEPNLSLLEATLGSKKHIIKAITHVPWLLTHNPEKHVIPNLKILRENNIPIDRLFTKYPRILYKHPDIIVETINKLKGLGMCPSNLAFTYGMNVLCGLKKKTWKRKIELYGSFGWSEKDTLLAFTRQPTFMGLSDEKIKKKMEFFNDKLEWDARMVLRQPVVLTLSLEKRIIPRCALLSSLTKNGLWDRKLNAGIFTMGEKTFVERFVDRYEKELPEVIDAYQGKIAFVGFQSMEGKSDN